MAQEIRLLHDRNSGQCGNILTLRYKIKLVHIKVTVEKEDNCDK